MIKKAIILAAGQGLRLRPLTVNRPKCLLPVGGKAVIQHQVAALRSQGIDRISVVTGFLGEMIEEILGTGISYIENREFAETASMYSLWLARDAAREGFVVLNGDVLFHPGILRSLLSSPRPDALAVDLDSVMAEEEMKVAVEKERVSALSKTLAEADGENVGMIKFSPLGSRILFSKIEEILSEGHRKEMVPYAVSAIARDLHLAAVPVDSLPWIEMDFAEDYQKAREEIFPAIRKDLESIEVGTPGAAHPVDEN
jgi:choline kinase